MRPDASYRKLLQESQDAMDAMEQKCVDLKASVAEENKLISDLQETFDDKQAQKDATDEYLDDLKENCDWIMSEFENRKKQRKDELAGLDDAKSALAGMKSAAPAPSARATRPARRSRIPPGAARIALRSVWTRSSSRW